MKLTDIGVAIISKMSEIRFAVELVTAPVLFLCSGLALTWRRYGVAAYKERERNKFKCANTQTSFTYTKEQKYIL